MTDNGSFELKEVDGKVEEKRKRNPKQLQITVPDGSGEDEDKEVPTRQLKMRSIRKMLSRKSRRSRDGDEDGPEQVLSPTHASHLGIFQFMHFEYQNLDSKPALQDAPEDLEDPVPLSSKEQLRHILHSQAIHIIIIILVLLDSVLVIFELLFDFRVIGPPSGEHIAREIFHGCSIGILSVFMIELILKLWADYTHFIRHKIEVLDAIVVTVSWVIDIVLVFVPSINLLAVELLLLLRLWRVFRIINGIIVAVKTKADEKLHDIKEENETLHEQLVKAEDEVKALKKDVQMLKKLLSKHGIDVRENRI